MKLTQHFDSSEFWCKCGPAPTALEPHLRHLAAQLEVIRQAVGCPLRVTSGWRCTEHNMQAGGVRGSKHLSGMAADLQPLGGKVSLETLAKTIVELAANGAITPGAVGLYSRHVHYDTGGKLRMYKGSYRKP